MNAKQKILVTGAAAGFGFRIAKTLAAAGHTVFATMRDPEGRNAPKAAALAAARVRGRIHALELDVTDEASVDAAIRQAAEREGGLDAIINNAGVGPGLGAYGETVGMDQFRHAFEVNVVRDRGRSGDRRARRFPHGILRPRGTSLRSGSPGRLRPLGRRAREAMGPDRGKPEGPRGARAPGRGRRGADAGGRRPGKRSPARSSGSVARRRGSARDQPSHRNRAGGVVGSHRAQTSLGFTRIGLEAAQ